MSVYVLPLVGFLYAPFAGTHGLATGKAAAFGHIGRRICRSMAYVQAGSPKGKPLSSSFGSHNQFNSGLADFNEIGADSVRLRMTKAIKE